MHTSKRVRSIATAGAAALALSLGAPGTARAQLQDKAMESAASIVLRAEVAAIDRADRHLTLVGPRGDVVEVAAGEEVRNFDQIEVGDEVKVTYLESLVVYVGEPGFLPEDKGAVMAGRAAEGEKPGAMMAETIDIAASVLVIDRKRRELTFMLSDGTTTTTDVDLSVEEFDDLEIGDTVHARLTRAVAIAVEASPE